MLFIYRFLINIILITSPIIFLFRVYKKKENLKSYIEKLGFSSKRKNRGNLIWFHGASVGELQSIIPLLERFEKEKKITQILVTSNTLSSSKIIQKQKLKKTIHQFFPIDSNFISKKFINYWSPSKAYFIDSEIWPNTILNLKLKKIPMVLINGRISKKSFGRWNFFQDFSKKIFSNFNLCLASSNESLNYLKKLKIRNVKFIGNLKFSQSENKISEINQKLKKFFIKKKVWCASSTHQSEEIICGNTHLKLKKKFKNIITVIIPRHIERSHQIKKDLNKLNLKVHLDEPQQRISSDTDIYLVNSYGKTKFFFNNIKNIFLGGSLIKHGGQNPLEAARFGCNILNGPYVENFREIYKFLENNNISQKILNEKEFVSHMHRLFNKKTRSNQIQKKLKLIGENILKKSYKEINLY
jgi:3-deoxy-D-manno-octulosonic-acid transferase